MDGVRGELEVSYMRYSAIDYTDTGADAPDPVRGDQNLYFILANVWKDFNAGGGLMPYVGGGIGVGIADIDISFSPPDSEHIVSTDIALAG